MTALAQDGSALRESYDVVIVGGAMMGSAAAWFLSDLEDFSGSVLVVERDMTFAYSSTAHTNSCIRQQFSSALNVRMSQFTAQFIRSLSQHIPDANARDLTIRNFGYLYLADSPAFADTLRRDQALQAGLGAGTQLLDAAGIARRYPFYRLDDIVLGSLNTLDEGYWDGGALFEAFRRSARRRGVQTVAGEVVAIDRRGGRIGSVTLSDGTVIGCGALVNASGPRGARTAAMAGLDLPVEPRKRFTYVIEAQTPLPVDLPLTIDPCGIHMRQDGPRTYMIGAAPPEDTSVEPDDFTMDHTLWEDRVWPAIANRIPAFEAVRVITQWTGHYAYNTVDRNAVIGPHPEVENFIFLNGFSGHGLQHAPAMGRGVAEWITFGTYRSMDLSPLGYGRLHGAAPVAERAVI